MTNSAETMVGPAPLQNVIDRSMTVLAETMVGPAPLQNVVDRSMTILASIRNGLSQKIVIDWSMTILKQASKNVID